MIALIGMAIIARAANYGPKDVRYLWRVHRYVAAVVAVLVHCVCAAFGALLIMFEGFMYYKR